ncbi:MAG: 4Fe-4S dicluster protein [Bacteroidetes bacterium]|jgi:ferredoxin|nr:4Fe-4S dicluster protein [Bacteroidota bacterium]
MNIEVNKSRCPHNHFCPIVRVCPVNAVSQNSEGYPVIDHELCIDCGNCLHYCPTGAFQSK